jgi:hypothetical protein
MQVHASNQGRRAEEKNGGIEEKRECVLSEQARHNRCSHLRVHSESNKTGGSKR